MIGALVVGSSEAKLAPYVARLVVILALPYAVADVPIAPIVRGESTANLTSIDATALSPPDLSLADTVTLPPFVPSYSPKSNTMSASLGFGLGFVVVVVVVVDVVVVVVEDVVEPELALPTVIFIVSSVRLL